MKIGISKKTFDFWFMATILYMQSYHLLCQLILPMKIRQWSKVYAYIVMGDYFQKSWKFQLTLDSNLIQTCWARFDLEIFKIILSHPMLQRRRDDWLANCALALRMRTLLKGLSCSKMMSTLHFLILLKNHKAVKDSRSSLKVMKKIGNEFLLEWVAWCFWMLCRNT